jgi:hypothetical protein
LSKGGIYAAMWQRQIMDGDDFASPITEIQSAKPGAPGADVSLERNWRAAPIG